MGFRAEITVQACHRWRVGSEAVSRVASHAKALVRTYIDYNLSHKFGCSCLLHLGHNFWLADDTAGMYLAAGTCGEVHVALSPETLGLIIQRLINSVGVAF